MDKELYMKSCCIDKKLPKMLRDNDGRMITFYSQGDWNVEHLWDAVSHLVEGAKIHMLLVLPCLDRHIVDAVIRYKHNGWFSRLTIICHTSLLTFSQMEDFYKSLSEIMPSSSVSINIGKRAAAQQPMWLRWDEESKQTLMVSGPMFSSKVGNPAFAMYTASFSSNDDMLVGQATEIWADMIEQKV